MKLNTSSIDYINTVLRTAQLVGIESVIIEPGIVRAIDEARTVVLVQDTGVPDMAFGSIAIDRISKFRTRYDVVQKQVGFEINATVDDSTSYARALVMKAKGTKIDYRCANPKVIEAPKKIRDIPNHQIQLSGDAVVMFQKGLAAMSSDTVSIISNDGVTFEFKDDAKDVFSYQVAEQADALTKDAVDKFAYTYPAKTLLALFKYDASNTFTIGAAGTLQVVVDNLTVTVLPKV